MRIERINENSISCTLTSFDLSVRNMNLRELAYGSEKAKKLFDEMMTKASTEVGFHVDNTPLMIEAIPMSSDSIKLIISKVTDPEELDTRFSRFTKDPAGTAKTEGESWLSKLTSALLEGAGGLADQLQKLTPQSVNTDDAKKNADAPQGTADTDQAAADAPAVGLDAITASDYRAFSFDDLDPIIRASKAASAFDGTSILYKNPHDGRFVLVIECKGTTGESFAKTCNVIAEYGRMMKTVQSSLSYFEEHYQPVIREKAVEKLAAL